MNFALIVAAGSGSRMGNIDKPKQFLLINNKPLMVYTIEAFELNKQVDAIVIVTSKDYIDEVNSFSKKYSLNKIKAVVIGGDTRQLSVYNGLQTIKALSKDYINDIVLIHDAARPLVTQKIITENIRACIQYDAINTAIKASDTIVRSLDEQSINDVPSRKELYQGQTPQTFKLSLILEAHEYAKTHHNENVTDDCQLVLSLNKKVRLVEGNKQNFKITTLEDLELFNALVNNK